MSMDSPTATQVESEAHDTPDNTRFPLGAVGSVQLVPPSVVTMIPPDGGPALLVPTATQSVDDGQETALSSSIPSGGASDVHVRPPSLVAMIPPYDPAEIRGLVASCQSTVLIAGVSPTAMQATLELQETPVSW